MIIRVLCAWLLGAGLAAAQPSAARDTVEQAALANAEFVLWLKVTRALAYQHGRYPDDWTRTVFALGRIADSDDARDIERLLAVAEAWLIARSDGTLPASLADDGLGANLARRVLCYVADEGPGRAHALMATFGTPRGSLACAAQMARDFDAAAVTYRQLPSGMGDTIPIRYGDDRWSRIAARAELLEAMADRLSADFDWPKGLRLEIAPCGAADASHPPDGGAITLCAQAIGYFHALADMRFAD